MVSQEAAVVPNGCGIGPRPIGPISPGPRVRRRNCETWMFDATSERLPFGRGPTASRFDREAAAPSRCTLSQGTRFVVLRMCCRNAPGLLLQQAVQPFRSVASRSKVWLPDVSAMSCPP